MSEETLNKEVMADAAEDAAAIEAEAAAAGTAVTAMAAACIPAQLSGRTKRLRRKAHGPWMKPGTGIS